MLNTIVHGDCLEVMRDIPDGSVDMILADLPYGTTQCKWDAVIPFEPLWKHYARVARGDGAIVLFGSQPFTSALVMSNPKLFRYSWVWDKRFGANFGVAKIQPIKRHEDILVFSIRPHRYYPQMIERDVPIKIGKNGANSGERGVYGSNGMNRADYNKKEYTQKYPESIQLFSVRDGQKRLHPTQKPVALLEYLIKTYTRAGEIVLDNTCGSGSTCVAAVNTGRNFIGIEKELEYVEISRQRVADAIAIQEMEI